MFWTLSDFSSGFNWDIHCLELYRHNVLMFLGQCLAIIWELVGGGGGVVLSNPNNLDAVKFLTTICLKISLFKNFTPFKIFDYVWKLYKTLYLSFKLRVWNCGWNVLSDQSSTGLCVGHWHVQTIDMTYQLLICLMSYILYWLICQSVVYMFFM